MSPEEAKTALKYGKYIILDTENSDFQPNDNYGFLIEVAAVKVRNNQVVDTFSELINPGIKIKKKITTITGITNDMLKDKDVYNDVLTRFRKWCDDDNYILIMHNAPHDLAFLNYFGKKCGVQFNEPYIDTMTLARNALKNGQWKEINSRVNKSFSLENLAVFFNIQDNEHHRALNDARVTWEVFERLRNVLFKNDTYLYYKQDWKYPNVNNHEEVPEMIKLISASPWDKKKRLYVSMSTKKSNEEIFCTAYYDFTFSCWGIKETGFPIPSFKKIEDKIKSLYNTEELTYELFDGKKYFNSCYLNLS